MSSEREGKEQLVTRVKRGLGCAGHWVVGNWAINRLEWPSVGVEASTLQTALGG